MGILMRRERERERRSADVCHSRGRKETHSTAHSSPLFGGWLIHVSEPARPHFERLTSVRYPILILYGAFVTKVLAKYKKTTHTNAVFCMLVTTSPYLGWATLNMPGWGWFGAGREGWEPTAVKEREGRRIYKTRQEQHNKTQCGPVIILISMILFPWSFEARIVNEN